MISLQPLTAPLRVSANGRFVVSDEDVPFFWLADTAWPLFTCYPAEVAKLYLSRRAEQGFTVIQGVFAWGNPFGNDLTGTPPQPNPEGEQPWGASPAEPNPAFFDYAARLIEYAGQCGLVMACLPTWGYNVNQARAFTPETARFYGRWLGERFRDVPNLIWLNGGDREPLGFEDIYRALAHGLREGDEGKHLITYHPCGWRSSSYYFQEEDWLDINMIETWTAWDRVYPAVIADYCLTPTRPVILGEGAYEDGPEYLNGPITPLIIRRQAWWTHMAGGFHTYGQNQMWRMELGWETTFDTPGALHMGIFRRIAASREWWNMIPDQCIFDAGTESSGRTLNAALRRRDRRGAIAYISHPCHVRIHLDRISTPFVQTTWINPATGEEQEGGIHATGNGIPGGVFPLRTAAWFQTPQCWEDAVLLLDGVSKAS